jgi:hypothetical protein
MHRIVPSLALIVSVVLVAPACSKKTADERAEQQQAALAARDGAAGEEVTITGCLTASPDRDAFVVTADRNALVSGALYSGTGETPTYTYELTGNVSELPAHVGRQVEVTGLVDKKRDDEVKVDDERETKLPEVQSGKDKVTPAIETDAEMEINVRRLSVSAVKATGRSCIASGR